MNFKTKIEQALGALPDHGGCKFNFSDDGAFTTASFSNWAEAHRDQFFAAIGVTPEAGVEGADGEYSYTFAQDAGLDELTFDPKVATLGKRFGLKAVQIFRTGKWNGDKYSVKDIDDMIAAFDEAGFAVPLKVGHAERSGDPAHGWIEKIYRKGELLLADIADVPQALYEMIKDRQYDAVSSEIFFNLERNGKRFRRVLKAVAVLGAETPAVADLEPLRTVVNSNSGDVVRYPDKLETLTETPNMDELLKKFRAMSKDELVEARDGANQHLTVAQASNDTGTVATHSLELAAANQVLAEFADKATADSVADVKRLRDEMGDGTTIATLQARIDATERELADSRKQRKQESIDTFAAKVPVPALRSHAKALYGLALDASVAQTVVKFSVTDGDGKTTERDTDPVKVVEDLFDKINKHTSATLLQVHSDGSLQRDDDAPQDDNVNDELQSATEAYCAKHKVDKNDLAAFTDAQDAVLAGNPELRARYNQAVSGGVRSMRH
jgi:hypothetical protein